MRRPAASFVRFAIVGVCSNGALYLAYLALCLAGLGPKTAMTVSFLLGTTVTFAFNRNWSFQSDRAVPGAFVRYAATYALGYVFNFVALVLLVDLAGYPHQLVQGAMVVLVAILMFIVQRRWVFGGGPGAALAEATPPDR